MAVIFTRGMSKRKGIKIGIPVVATGETFPIGILQLKDHLGNQNIPNPAWEFLYIPATTILISVIAIISNDFDVLQRQIKVLRIKVLQ